MSPVQDDPNAPEGDPDEEQGTDTGDLILAAASAAQALEKFGQQIQIARSAHDPALKAVLQAQMTDAKRHVARVLAWMSHADTEMGTALGEELAAHGAELMDEEPTSSSRMAVAAAPAPAPAHVPAPPPAPAPVPPPVAAAAPPPHSGSNPAVPQGPGPVTFVRDVRLNPNTRIRG